MVIGGPPGAHGGGGGRLCFVPQYVRANTLVLYVYLKLNFDVVFTKLDYYWLLCCRIRLSIVCVVTDATVKCA